MLFIFKDCTLMFTMLIVLHLNFIFVVNSSYMVVYLLLVKCVLSPCVRIVHRTIMMVEPLHACLFCVCMRSCSSWQIVMVWTDYYLMLLLWLVRYTYCLVECCMLFAHCLVSILLCWHLFDAALLHWLDWCRKVHSYSVHVHVQLFYITFYCFSAKEIELLKLL